MINIISFIIISFIVNFKIMRNLNLSPSCIVYQHHHHHMYNINISQLTIWHHPLCGCFVNVFYFSIRTNLSPGRTVVMIWYGMEAIQTQKPYNIHISLEWWKIACSYHLTMMIMIINMIWKTGWCWIWICSNIEDDDVAVTTLCIIPSIPHILYKCCRFIIHFWWLQIGIKGWKKLMTMVSYVCSIRKNVP